MSILVLEQLRCLLLKLCSLVGQTERLAMSHVDKFRWSVKFLMVGLGPADLAPLRQDPESIEPATYCGRNKECTAERVHKLDSSPLRPATQMQGNTYPSSPVI